MVALAGWLLPGQPANAEGYEVTETPEDLPEGKGRDETFYACSACHGTALIKAQGMSRERWDATIDWMIERHGMPEIDLADRTLIVDYLAETFPSRQRGRSNPFLK
jgi:mono/diheme cytochrome c family protein